MGAGLVKRICAMMLGICIILAGMPGAVYAAETGTETAIRIVGDTVIPETLLFEQDGVRVTAVGLRAERDSVCLEISGYNRTGGEVILDLDSSYVNDFKILELAFLHIPAGGTASGTIGFDAEDLAECGIERILTVDLRFEVLSGDYGLLFANENLIRLTTSSYGQFSQSYDMVGTTAYDNYGVRIVALSSIEEGYSGKELKFYIENNTETDVFIKGIPVKVNGVEVEDDLYCSLESGKRGVVEVTVDWEMLYRNHIERINEVDINLLIFTLNQYYIDAHQTYYIDALEVRVTY